MDHTQEQKQSIEFVPEEARADLLEKYFKSDSLNMSTKLKEILSKEIKKTLSKEINMRIMSR